jgi:hypothetical protein
MFCALVLFYTGRAWWIARHDWRSYDSDTKCFYLLVSPLLILAIDVLTITDRIYWCLRSLEFGKAPLSHSTGRSLEKG